MRVPFLAVVIFVLLSSASPAEAHTRAFASDPADGALLGHPPNAVRVWFGKGSEKSNGTLLLLDDADSVVPGTALKRGPSGEFTLVLPPLTGGRYIVVWKTLAADSHIAGGSISFTVVGPGPEPSIQPGMDAQAAPAEPAYPTVKAASLDQWQRLTSLLKMLQLLGAIMMSGGCVFLAAVWYPAITAEGTGGTALVSQATLLRRVQLLTCLGAVLLTTGAVTNLIQLGVFALVTTAAVRPDPKLSMLWSTWAGVLLMLRILLGLVALFAVRRWKYGRWYRWVVGPSTATLFTFSLSGHSAASAVSAIADSVHLIAAGSWYGGLICLAVLPWSTLTMPLQQRLVFAVVRRFSGLGLCAMLLLGATGTLLALARFPAPASLIGHPYGRTLLFKLAILTGVLAIAAVNLLWVRRWLGDPVRCIRAVRVLRWLVTGEVTMGAVIFVAASLLSTSEPPGP